MLPRCAWFLLLARFPGCARSLDVVVAVAVPRDGTQLEKLPSLEGNSVHHNQGYGAPWVTVDILSISTHAFLNTSLSHLGHSIPRISSTDFQLEHR